MKLETPADIHFMMDAHFASAVLNAAMERELFWRLDGGPKAVEAIAESLGIPATVCRSWLRLLASLALLEEQGDGYVLSPPAQTAIVEANEAGTWAELAREERRKWPGDLALIDGLIHPGSALQSKSSRLGPDSDYVQAMIDDPQQARRFTYMLYDLHAPLAGDIARQLDIEGARRLLDLGGGSGVVSLALLDAHPELTAVVVDIVNVCAIGREIADGTPVAGRISYLPADFYRDDLPGRYDLILACDILGYDQGLIDKAAAHLEAGGRFVIVDRWFEDRQSWSIGQSTYLLRRSLRDPGFSLPLISEVYDRLRSAGLEPIAREEIPYGRWQMIQARKGEVDGAG